MEGGEGRREDVAAVRTTTGGHVRAGVIRELEGGGGEVELVCRRGVK